MNKIKILKIVAIMSGIFAILQFIYPFFRKSSVVGIIGSADGPTVIFVAHSSNIFYSLLKYGFAVICVISVIFIVALKNRERK
jgi:Na+-transporting methylmalonyl-CoA/oxaloacetate decarboxylase beta subunit